MHRITTRYSGKDQRRNRIETECAHRRIVTEDIHERDWFAPHPRKRWRLGSDQGERANGVVVKCGDAHVRWYARNQATELFPCEPGLTRACWRCWVTRHWSGGDGSQFPQQSLVCEHAT